jgi:hypothetical protein
MTIDISAKINKTPVKVLGRTFGQFRALGSLHRSMKTWSISTNLRASEVCCSGSTADHCIHDGINIGELCLICS